MFSLIAVLVLALGVGAPVRDSSRKSCTRAEAIQAETEVDSLINWDRVYRSYGKFSQCDDGVIGEGYSDAVGKLLANDWVHLDRLTTLTKANGRFRQFVVKHIDGTLSRDTLNKISSNAQSNCPTGAGKLCGLIARAVSLSLPTTEFDSGQVK